MTSRSPLKRPILPFSPSTAPPSPSLSHSFPIPPLPRTLILDYHDSYTNNLLTLFTSLYPASLVASRVVVIEHDHPAFVDRDAGGLEEVVRLCREEVDCVILSPGPGRPDRREDVGWLVDLIRRISSEKEEEEEEEVNVRDAPPLSKNDAVKDNQRYRKAVPILGICLGMQALGVAYGAKITNVPRIRHGHLIPVKYDLLDASEFNSLFEAFGGKSSRVQNGVLETEGLQERETESEELGEVQMVSYNSLMVDWENSFPEKTLKVVAWSEDEPELSPAPTSEDSHLHTPSSNLNRNRKRKCIQALRHVSPSIPHLGVQFHPESIASHSGHLILSSFLRIVHRHLGNPERYPSLRKQVRDLSAVAQAVLPSASRPASPAPTRPSSPSVKDLEIIRTRLKVAVAEGSDSSRKVDGSEKNDVFDRLIRVQKSPLGEIWLDGVSPRAPTTSSMAIPVCVITFSLATRVVRCDYVESDGKTLQKAERILPHGIAFWDWFDLAQAELKSRLKIDSLVGGAEATVTCNPGWIGWWGYEMKAETLEGYHPTSVISAGIDACWAWCPTIVQKKQQDGEWTVLSLIETESKQGGTTDQSEMVRWMRSLGISLGMRNRAAAEEWISQAEKMLSSPREGIESTSTPPMNFIPPSDSKTYKRDIERCRDRIYAGDSYELTLTTQFARTLPPAFKQNPRSASYHAYLQLRKNNPAPYSTYIYLPTIETSILSSSPERFIRIDRTGRVEMKPIKGTKARIKCTCGTQMACEGPGGSTCMEEMARRDAENAQELQDDLKERAENLMIVDLIRSDLHSCCRSSTVEVPKLIKLETYERVHQLVTTVTGMLETGVDEIQAVKRCFPPGSMTGAPKLRSVEIIEDLEAKPRGIYSGALGYMSIDGTVDLSVVIRTIVSDGQSLSIGGGGAITWLSKPLDEWEEVLTKVHSVTKSFV